MTKRQEKGKVGTAAQYITRAQALKKLQLSLADFRRLCILKGVYPRTPSKKPQGADKTYYHVRDIRYLAADPVRFQLYEEEATTKKKSKLVGRGRLALARELEKRTSQGLDLSHIIRERYPTFAAALMDLDDCVSTLALIGSIPTDKEAKFSAEVISECSNLYTEFLAYVASTGGLMKTFASIKGFYLQASLPEGAKVTWLHPHRFSNEIPADVDMKVLNTFCLWYRTLLKFVLFKLYQDQGWKFPVAAAPKVKSSQASYLVWLCTSGKLTRQSSSEQTGAAQTASLYRGVFAFLSREVPLVPVYVSLWSAGATKVLVEALGETLVDGITHVIVDRPASAVKTTKDREYVQPQYILDSLNEGMLLSTKEYLPGATLPPHLSPFAEGDEEYLPQRRVFLDELKKKRARAVDLAGGDDDEVGQEAEVEQRRLKRLNAEAKGEAIEAEDVEQEEKEAAADEEQEVVVKTKAKELKTDSTMLLSKKHRRLLEKIEGGKKIKRDAAAKLRQKAQAKAKTQ